MRNYRSLIQKELSSIPVLLRSVPPLVFALYVVSVIGMNLLANKELYTSSWLALDCGFALSWVSFLTMDCVCKRFGGKAATYITICAVLINLLTFGVFHLLMYTPGNWGAYYATGSDIANQVLDQTIGGSTWIVLGSALAMLVSAVVNSVTNVSVAKMLRTNGYGAFVLRSLSSTALGQFVDNMVFALVVSVPLFGWSMKQVLFCSLTAMVFELSMEAVFSGFGYRMAKKWEEENVGKEYLEYVKASLP